MALHRLRVTDVVSWAWPAIAACDPEPATAGGEGAGTSAHPREGEGLGGEGGWGFNYRNTVKPPRDAGLDAGGQRLRGAGKTLAVTFGHMFGFDLLPLLRVAIAALQLLAALLRLRRT